MAYPPPLDITDMNCTDSAGSGRCYLVFIQDFLNSPLQGVLIVLRFVPVADR